MATAGRVKMLVQNAFNEYIKGRVGTSLPRVQDTASESYTDKY
jgi:hypothetical protein